MTYNGRARDLENESLECPPLHALRANLMHAGQTGAYIDILPYRFPDPGKPTVIVFDKFTLPIGSPTGDEKSMISHGQVSADAAEQNGYNVIRVAETSPGPQFHLEHALPELADLIEDGTLAAGAGDVLNISAVKSISFADARRTLGLPVTAANLKQLVPLILERMEQLAAQPFQSEEIRRFLQRQIASNRAVQRIRRCNLEVVVAGGNDGPECFNIALLTATTQLSAKSTERSGEVHPWSANNSLTTPAISEVCILVRAGSSSN